MLKILFLSANPNQTNKLELIKEYHLINQNSKSIAGKEVFKLEQRYDIPIKHLREELLYYNLKIIHFSGRDTNNRNVLSSKNENTGQVEEISPSALSNLFQTLGKKIDIVVLNACYSEKQARAIAEHVNCVIGISDAVSDVAAIEFASTFYSSLGFGKSVQEAFDLAIVHLDLLGIPENAIPKLIVKEGVNLSKINPGQSFGAPSIIGNSLAEFPHIERYPSARFPDEVKLNDVIPLEVVIKSSLPAVYKRFISIKLQIELQIEHENLKEIPVQIIIECDDDGFEIVGKYYAIINVPVELKDSNPIVFNIKSKKEGKHTLHIRFFQQTTYVGEITLEPFVTISKNQSPTVVSNSQIKEWKSNYEILEKIIPGPDITIFIHERKISSDFEYDVLVSSLDIPIQEMGPIKFPFNPETKFHKLFEDIENLNAPSVTIIDRKIKAKGMSLYEELFPDSLKELYWEKHDKIKSIRVISKEPWIPWEIIKPWRKLENGEIKEDPFLCENYAFSRWIVGERERFKEKIKSIKVVVPNDTNLEAAIKERNWIEEFVKDKNIKMSFDSSYDQVINTLETGRAIDILHFSTHGLNNIESPLLSEILLEGNVKLRPEEIVGNAMTFGQSHPIVILNACQTGNQNFSLTGIQGWATRFLEAGASVFIGTLWSVNDETAFNFVREFYIQLAYGLTLGESVKNARNNCKKEGDTSWLAYQLYGHPNSTIKF